MQKPKLAAVAATCLMFLVATLCGAEARVSSPAYTGSYSNGIWERGSFRKPVKRSAHRKQRLSPPPPAALYGNSTRASGGDYLAQVSEGGRSRWAADKMPLNVYITPSPYGSIAASAFDEWQRISAGRISWTRAHSPSSADIVVRWSREGGPRGGGHEAGLTHTRTGLDDYGEEYIEHADISISTHALGRAIAQTELKKTALHEIGHALGLNGHSSNSSDIMFAMVTAAQKPYLNSRDRATINRLYGR